MNVYKKELPAGVRKRFELRKGIKVKVINSLYCKKNKKNKDSK